MAAGKIGVIVPVYKTEEFVAECIESILAQTYTNFRLILVDDGSPDNAGAICDEFAKKESRITVIHQKNAGVTRARANGVESATDCEWITFVDSDDTITTDALEELINATNEDVDIVLNELHIAEDCIPTDLWRKELIRMVIPIGYAPWAKLFNKKLFNELTFSIPREIVVGEDVIMNVRLAFASSKEFIKVIHENIYNYKIREDSACQSYKSDPLHEELFYEHLVKYLPATEQELWQRATIEPRVNKCLSAWGYRYHIKDIFASSFYKLLKSDVQKNNYKLSFVDKVLFYNTNPFIRFIFSNIKKCINILKGKKKK